MSDRRVVVLLLALLGGLGGLALLTVSLMLLEDPMLRGGDLGAETDATAPLIAGALTGIVIALIGAVVATRLVRRQLDARRDSVG